MKTYVCKKTDQYITIDGNFNKAEWSGIHGVTLVDTATGEQPKQETTAKMMWNDEFLYIAFYCKDTYINATLTGYNDPLFQEEVVEVFIDDNKDLKTYIELEVNPLNALLHYYIQNDLQDVIYKYARVGKEVKTAVVRDDEKGFWSAEMAVPLKEFTTAPNMPPKPGDKWFFNFYRIDRPKDGNDEYCAWSPTGKLYFHVPQKFGELVFA
ncbi:MAG: carbohydrate-binding family 9-like protein [Clostridia bacterium]|nr:carbohydrate-binding family 9-like protein [Clostridia bacterium]